jgi:hypothetical protein
VVKDLLNQPLVDRVAQQDTLWKEIIDVAKELLPVAEILLAALL